MADGNDTLASVGGKITEVFINAFESSNPSMSLVFLQFAIPVPDDMVQGGIVNPTRMTAFLVPNFDAPYLMSAPQYAVHGKDTYYGTASQIYSLAVNYAQPTAPIGSPGWKRVDSEIAMAQSVLNPAGISVAMACVPDDWVSPDNKSYWSTFNSTQTQGPTTTPTLAPTATPGGVAGNVHSMRVVSSSLWAIKPAAAQTAPAPTLGYIHAISPAAIAPAPAATTPQASTSAAAHPLAAASLAKPSIAASALRPANRTTAAVAPVAHAPAAATVWRRPFPIGRRPPFTVHPTPTPTPTPPPPPPPPPPATSSMMVNFQYMSVTIGYMAAGIPVWNGVLLADSNWCVPQMAKGALLPAPDPSLQEGHGPLAYGLPVSLIVVKDLTISVKWSGQDKAALGSSGGFIGPFSLAGATPTTQPDGAWNYTQPGMQVVALLCSHLPVLPPADAPDVPQANAAASGASSAATRAASSPPPPNATASAAGNAANAPATSAGVGASGASPSDAAAAESSSSSPNATASAAGNAAHTPATSAGAGASGAPSDATAAASSSPAPNATASAAGNAAHTPATSAGAGASGAPSDATAAASSSPAPNATASAAGNAAHTPATSAGAGTNGAASAASSSPSSSAAAGSAGNAANAGTASTGTRPG